MPAPAPSPRTSGSDLEQRQVELAALIQRLTPAEGLHATAIDGLHLIRTDQPTLPMPVLYNPCLCIIAQGSKEVRLAEQPYLSLRLDIDPTQLSGLIADAGPIGLAGTAGDGRGLFLDRIDDALLDAVIRLTRLLESPRDIAMLAPLALREIFYRLLHSPQGRYLHEIAIADSQGQRIARAIDWLNKHYDQPLRIEHLAREVNLSPSTLHHRFKTVTALSPLQYQKQLLLQEARRLMLCEGLEAASASYRVGYESPSQFSREYSRLFGAPPLRDLARFRNSA